MEVFREGATHLMFKKLSDFVIVKAAEMVCVQASSLEADFEAVCLEEVCFRAFSGAAPAGREGLASRTGQRKELDSKTL